MNQIRTITWLWLQLYAISVFGQSDSLRQVNYIEETNIFHTTIRFYQKYISHIRPYHCPMYPSCSRYGFATFQYYNPFKAMIYTADRLLRCGHDYRFYPLTLQDNGFRFVDLPIIDSVWLDTVLYLNTGTKVFPYAKYPMNFAWADELKFIRFLMEKELYSEALLEIYRVFHYSKKLSISEENLPVELYVNLLRSLKALNRHEEAIWEYEGYFPEDIKKNVNVKFEICKIWFDLNNTYKAIECFNEVALRAKRDTFLLHKIYIFTGVTYARSRQIDSAKRFFSLVTASSSLNYLASKNLNVVTSVEKAKLKKPVVAGMLAIIPGAGYLYSGHWQTAISSLFVNSLLFYATYSSFKVKNYGIALLSGIFSMTFYVGNIIGSVRSSKRYNQTVIDEQLSQMVLPN